MAGHDLLRIDGIGQVLAAQLAALGVNSLTDIARWSHDDIMRFDKALNVNGRIERDDWIGQAKTLTGGNV